MDTASEFVIKEKESRKNEDIIKTLLSSVVFHHDLVSPIQ